MMAQRTCETSGGRFVLPQAVGSFRSRARFSSFMTRACAMAVAFAALGLALDPAPLMAKRRKPPTSKTVVGQVLDPSGNGIIGAAVEMTNLTTGKTLAIYTGPQGHFQFTDLKLTQDYQFRAHYRGESSEVRKVSSWDTRTSLVLNLHIPPPKD
jgi:Carboxypeptidase regulatory-like domain